MAGWAEPLVGPQYGVVAIMWTDPEPHEAFMTAFCECAIATTDPHRPQDAHLLESYRRVTRIALERLKVLVREVPNFWRKLPIMKPKLR